MSSVCWLNQSSIVFSEKDNNFMSLLWYSSFSSFTHYIIALSYLVFCIPTVNSYFIESKFNSGLNKSGILSLNFNNSRGGYKKL